MLNAIINYVRYNLYKERHNLVLWIPVFQCLGILFYFSLSFEPSLNFTVITFFLILIPLCIIYRKYILMCSVIASFLLGFTAIKVKTALVNTKVLAKERYIKDIVATVKNIHDKGTYKQLLLYKITGTRIDLDNIRISVRTELEKDIRIGDKVKLSAKLFPLKIAPSKYAYDFARIAYYLKISATGFATSKVILYQKIKTKKFQEYIEYIRQYFYENLQRNMRKPHADIVSALLIGKKEGIDHKTISAIRDSGIAHLFAISGLHLSFFASTFFLIFRNIFALSEVLTLKYNTKKISAWLTTLPTTFYLLITGIQISAQRAYIMVILVLVAIIIERKYRGLMAIAFTGSLILIIEPESVLHPGFQMSFSAVLALISSYQINISKLFNIKIIKYFISILTSSIIASIATLPYTIYSFNYLSISGIITNLIAIPVVTLIVIPLGIIYIFCIPLSVESLIVPLIEQPITIILYLVYSISELKHLIIPIHTFPAISVVIITLGILWICLWQQNWRFWGISFIIIGVYLGITYKPPDILVSNGNIAIKENDGLLYSLTKKNRNFLIQTWAQQNGQRGITNHIKFNQSSKRLKCDDFGCIYNGINNKLVLLAYKNEDINKNCNDVELIIQLYQFDFLPCKTKIIKYDDLNLHGTHSIWLTQKNIQIKKVRSARPWHKNLHSHSNFNYNRLKY